MRLLVIGANGQLGKDIITVFKDWEVIPLTHEDIEIAELDQVKSKIERFTPQILINTADYHDVPKCEKNHEKAFLVNAMGVKNLADVFNILPWPEFK